MFGERGLIKRAEQSSDVHGEQAAREKLVLKLNEYKIEIYEEKITKADEKDKLLKQRLEEVGPTTEATDPKYYEVKIDGWIFWVNRDTLEILSRGKAGKTVPVITNVTLTTGKNDIKTDLHGTFPSGLFFFCFSFFIQRRYIVKYALSFISFLVCFFDIPL